MSGPGAAPLSQLLTFHLSGALIETVQPRKTVKRTTHKPSSSADLTLSFKHERTLAPATDWAMAKSPRQHRMAMIMLIYSGVKQLVYPPGIGVLVLRDLTPSRSDWT